LIMQPLPESHEDEQPFDELVDRIVSAVSPERVILFGSAARGEMGPDSDLDVLIVKSGSYRHIDLMHAVRKALRGFPFAVDLVVATPEELDRFGESSALVYHSALTQGREIYAS
jgi:uncharacterized protein